MILDRKYRLVRQIGAGGMGLVFEAEHLQLKRLVAVKLVSGGAGPQAMVRLEREARLIASIKHENICALHDFGRSPNGDPYVVFERLFGETLAERAQGRLQLPVQATIALFSQLLSGLQAAHEGRIIHRDLKPQNVFLVDRMGREPLVKILDFGLAQDLSATGSRITRPGASCGTLQYMSPEQLRVEALDHRSDLFAVGIMLYEALAGRHPFAASSPVELHIKVLRDAPPPLRARRPDVPQELEQAIMWALSRSPAHRPSSAVELQRALLSTVLSPYVPSFADDEPVSATQPLWIASTSSPAA